MLLNQIIGYVVTYDIIIHDIWHIILWHFLVCNTPKYLDNMSCTQLVIVVSYYIPLRYSMYLCMNFSEFCEQYWQRPLWE